ncbi:MAG TPA: hypothetical protein VGS14_05415 [Actinomycetes bacterium]|nr:hypothetical protein [Actinomycetes bacterium]
MRRLPGRPRRQQDGCPGDPGSAGCAGGAADRYRRLGQRVGESNTKAGLIEPVIAALGWDVLDPDEVHREYRRRSPDNPVDYALLLSRTPRLFIEAKGLGGNIDDPRWANQTISYAAVAGVEWVALTDETEWRLYNAHAPVPVEQKLFRAVRLTEDIDAAFELLALLSKDNLPALRLAPSPGAAGDLGRFTGVYAWPDRRWEVTASDTHLVMEGDGGIVEALPLDDCTFVVDAEDPDIPTVTFGGFGASGRPAVLYQMLWGPSARVGACRRPSQARLKA